MATSTAGTKTTAPANKAETGRGMEPGAGLVLADSVTGRAVDIRVRRLLVDPAEGFAEGWRSISMSCNPTASTPLGFILIGSLVA